MSINRYLVVVLLVTVAASAQSQDELTPEMKRALTDLQTRHPEMHTNLSRMMDARPDEVRRHLTAHARYLETLNRTEKVDPARHRMLRRQEEMERGVRSMLETFSSLPDDSQERASLRDSIRGVLEKWFDLRQQFRRSEIASKRAELDELQTRKELEFADREGARKGWLQRIAQGGRIAMGARIEELGATEGKEALATHALRIIQEKNPDAGKKLARLAEQDRPRFLETIEGLLTEHPELEVAAMRAAREERRKDGTLREAVRRAHIAVLPHVGADGTLAVSRRKLEGLREVLDDVLDAEREVVEEQLAHARRMIDSREQLLGMRTKRKATIVDLQLSRLVGPQDLYEW